MTICHDMSVTRVYPQTFSHSALDGGERSATHPDRFTSAKIVPITTEEGV